MIRRFAVVCSMLLAGCSGVNPEIYQDAGPRLLVEKYFNGLTQGWGIVTDRSGKVIRRFTVELNGSWTDPLLTLEERFIYNDGEVQDRTWKITKLDQHNYQGSAGDVIGEARGLSYGNALKFNYTLRIKTESNEWDIKFEDWMYLQDDGILINKAQMSKFGFDVGEVTVFFSKPEHESPAV